MSRLAPVPSGWEVVESPIPDGWEVVQDAKPEQPAPQQNEYEFDGRVYSFSRDYDPDSVARWLNTNVMPSRRKLSREDAAGRSQYYDSEQEQKLRRSTPISQQGLKEWADFLSGEDAEGKPIVVKPEDVTPQAMAEVVKSYRQQAEEAAKTPGVNPVKLREVNEDIAAMERELDRRWPNETIAENVKRRLVDKMTDAEAIEGAKRRGAKAGISANKARQMIIEERVKGRTPEQVAADEAILNSRPGYVARKNQPKEAFWAENLLREYQQEYGNEIPRDKKPAFDNANKAYDAWLKNNPAGAEEEFDGWRRSATVRSILHPEEQKQLEEQKRNPNGQRYYNNLSEAMVAYHAYKTGDLDVVPYWLKRLPFAGTAVEAADLVLLRNAVKNIDANKATDSDWFTLAGAIDAAEKSKDRGFGRKVFDLVSQLPAMGVEFTMTGGGFTAARVGARKLAVQVLGKQLMRRAIPRMAVKAAGFAAGVAGRTALNAPLVAAKVAEKWMPEYNLTRDESDQLTVSITGDDPSFLEALGKGFGAAYIEMGSEEAGRILGVGGKALAQSKAGQALAQMPLAQRTMALRGALLNRFLANGGTAAKANEILRKAGWNGMIGEVFEERVADVAGGVTGIEKDYSTTGKLLTNDPEGWEQLAVEAVSFAAIPAGQTALSAADAAMAPADTRGPAQQLEPVPLAAQTELEKLREVVAKGWVTLEEAKDAGLSSEEMTNRGSRKAAVKARIQQLEQEIQDAAAVRENQGVPEEAGQVGEGVEADRIGDVYRPGQEQVSPEPTGEVAETRVAETPDRAELERMTDEDLQQIWIASHPDAEVLMPLDKAALIRDIMEVWGAGKEEAAPPAQPTSAADLTSFAEELAQEGQNAELVADQPGAVAPIVGSPAGSVVEDPREVERQPEPAAPVPAAVPKPADVAGEPEGREGVVSPKIGDAVQLMGTDAVLADVSEVEGVRYELYNAGRLKDRRGFVRVMDVDSGNIVTLKRYPEYDQAEQEYRNAVSLASAPESPQPPAPAEPTPEPTPAVETQPDATQEATAAIQSMDTSTVTGERQAMQAVADIARKYGLTPNELWRDVYYDVEGGARDIESILESPPVAQEAEEAAEPVAETATKPVKPKKKRLGRKAEPAAPTTAKDITETWLKSKGEDRGFYEQRQTLVNRFRQLAGRLLKNPWSTQEKLTVKNRQGQKDRETAGRGLGDMRDLGLAQVAWDKSGNAYWAAAGEAIPDHLMDEETADKYFAEHKAQGIARTDTLVPNKPDDSFKVQTISGKMDLEEFEAKGYAPNEVTRQEWVDLQRANRRKLGQPEESGTKYAPYADYEEYHKADVRSALERGEEVDDRVLADYPDLKPPQAPQTPAAAETIPEPTPPAETQQEAPQAVSVDYSGMTKQELTAEAKKRGLKHVSGKKVGAIRAILEEDDRAKEEKPVVAGKKTSKGVVSLTSGDVDIDAIKSASGAKVRIGKGKSGHIHLYPVIRGGKKAGYKWSEEEEAAIEKELRRQGFSVTRTAVNDDFSARQLEKGAGFRIYGSREPEAVPVAETAKEAKEPTAKQPWEMTAKEAVEAGVSYPEWSNAVEDAFRNEKIDENHPAWKSISEHVEGVGQWKQFEGQKLIGQKVTVTPPGTRTRLFGEVVGATTKNGLALVTVREPDGRETTQYADNVDDLAGWIADREKKGHSVPDEARSLVAPEPVEPKKIGKKAEPSEMMRQWDALKKASPDSILLLRVGDFYEAMGDDADVVASALGLTATMRGDTKMVGFPQQYLDANLAKLVKAGSRVSVADMVKHGEKPGKASVQRVVDEGSLVSEKPPTDIMSVKPDEQGVSEDAIARVEKMARTWETQARKDEGGKGYAAGAENINYRWAADATRSVIQGVRAGKTPAEAGEAAKAEARTWIERHNAKRKKDIAWQRWEGAADDYVDTAVRILAGSAETTEEAISTTDPAVAKETQAVAEPQETKTPKQQFQRITAAKGTPERDQLEAEYEKSYADYDREYEAVSVLKSQHEAAKYGSKKRDQLEKRLVKAREKLEKASKIHDPIKERRYLAVAEDLVESAPDEAARIIAIDNLNNRLRDANVRDESGKVRRVPNVDSPYRTILDMGEKIAVEMGSDPETAKRIALDAYPTIQTSYGRETLRSIIGRKLMGHNEERAFREAQAELESMDLDARTKLAIQKQLDANRRDPARIADIMDSARKTVKQVSAEKAAEKKASESAAVANAKNLKPLVTKGASVDQGWNGDVSAEQSRLMSDGRVIVDTEAGAVAKNDIATMRRNEQPRKVQTSSFQRVWDSLSDKGDLDLLGVLERGEFNLAVFADRFDDAYFFSKDIVAYLSRVGKADSYSLMSGSGLDLLGFKRDGKLYAVAMGIVQKNGSKKSSIPMDVKVARSPSPLSRASAAADKEVGEAFDKFKKSLRSRGAGSNLFLDPEILAAATNLTAKLVKAGVLRFAVAMERMTARFGKDRAEQYRPYMERAWDDTVAAHPEWGMEPRVPAEPEAAPPAEPPRVEQKVAEPAVSSDDLTSIKKAVVNDLRDMVGLPEMEGSTPQTVLEWAEQAETTLRSDPNAAIRLVNELANNPRPISQHDAMLLQFRYRQLANELKPFVDEYFAAVASKDFNAKVAARTALMNARYRMTEFEEIIHPSKETWGRAGVALQQMLRKDFSLEAVLRRGQEANNGEELSPEQVAELTKLAKQFEDLQKRFDEQSRKVEELERELASKAQHEEAVKKSKQNKGRSKSQEQQDAATRRKAAWENFKDKWAALGHVGFVYDPKAEAKKQAELLAAAVELAKSYAAEGFVRFREFWTTIKGNIGKDAAQAEAVFHEAWDQVAAEAGIAVPELDMDDLKGLSKDARRIQRLLVELGMTDRDQVIDTVHEIMSEDLPDLTRRAVMDALSQYGQFQTQSQNEIDKLIRDMNAEILKLSQADQLEIALKRVEELRAQGLSDEEIGDRLAQESLLVKATGLVRDRPTETVRQLTKQYNELKKQIPSTSEGRAGHLQTAQDASVRALGNRIRDVRWELEHQERIVRDRHATPDTDLIRALRAELDELMKIHREMFPPQRKQMTSEQKLAAAERAATRLLEFMQKQEAAGFPPAPVTPKPLTSAQLEATRKQIAEIRQRRDAAQREGKRLEQLDQQIAKLEERLKTGDIAPKVQPTPYTTPMIEARIARRKQLQKELEARQKAEMPELAEQRARKAYEANLLRRIADYQQILADGDFAPKPKKEARQVSASELKLKREMEDIRHQVMQKYAEYHLAHLHGIAWTADKIMETAHLSRALMTSFDLSALLRQGGLPAMGRPILAKRALFETVASIAGTFDSDNARALKGGLTLENIQRFLATIDSRQAEFNFMHQITRGADGEFRLRAGLNLPSTDEAITKQEEVFQGRWGKVVPGIALSSRLYTMILNKIRSDLFDTLVENIGRNGKVTMDEAKLIASFVNVATGRSDFKQFNKWAAVLNAAFFAPRYVASRFQYLAMPFYLPFKGGLKSNWRVKRAIYKEYARTAVGIGTVLGTLALTGMLFWDDDDDDKPTVEVDPRSSDFLKVRMGDTRLDFLAGLSQTVVLSTRLLLPEALGGNRTKSSVTGEVTKFGETPMSQTKADVVTRFLRSKLAPIPSTISTVWFYDWENVVGQKETPLSLAANLLLPLSLQDISKTMETQGIPKTAAMSLLSILGVGMSTYGPKTEYVTGTPEERAKQFKKDLKNLEWDSKPPAYSEFLRPEQMQQVADRLQEEQQTVVSEGLEPEPKRTRKDDDESYQKKLDTHEKARRRFQEMVQARNIDHARAQQLLVESYRKLDDKGKPQTELNAKNSRAFDESYWAKAVALAKLYGHAEPQSAVADFRGSQEFQAWNADWWKRMRER